MAKIFKTKRVRALLVGSCFSFVAAMLLSVNSEVLASRTAEINDSLKKIEQQIVDRTKSAQAAKLEATTLQGRVNRLQADINYAQQQINQLESSIKQTESAVNVKNKEISDKQKELDLQQINQNEIIKTIYETTNSNMLLFLAGSESLTDIIGHAEYLETLETDIELTMQTIESIKDELEKEKSQLEEQKRELSSLKSQQQAYRSGLVGERINQASLLAEAQKQQRAYETQVASATRLKAQLQAELAEINRRLRQIQPRDRGVSSVGFQWPTSGYITQYFGPASWNTVYDFHDGLDVANAGGTPIYAASSGTVLMSQYWGMLGNYIRIGHNARWGSGYAHMQTRVVVPGQEVRRGQLIGYMGTTGFSTGNHLHFQIFDYGKAVNPLSYLP